MRLAPQSVRMVKGEESDNEGIGKRNVSRIRP